MNRWACFACLLAGLIIGWCFGTLNEGRPKIGDTTKVSAKEPLPVSFPEPKAEKKYTVPLRELPIESDMVTIRHKGFVFDVCLMRVAGQDSVAAIPVGWDYVAKATPPKAAVKTEPTGKADKKTEELFSPPKPTEKLQTKPVDKPLEKSNDVPNPPKDKLPG